MRSINVNKLQSEVSKVIKECEKGTIFEVVRYSKSVAYLVPKKEFEKLQHKDCEKCLAEIRAVAKMAQKNVKEK